MQDKKYDLLLFDLDGTLSESGPGVKKCIELTLDELGIVHPDLSDYSRFVGPPLIDTFNNLCGIGATEKSKEAIKVYNKYYDVYGMPENRIYPSFDTVLEKIREKGIKTVVCTSKAERLAKQVIEQLGISGYFDMICGSLPNGVRKEKSEVIDYALDHFGISNDKKVRVLMIGDSKFDYIGAEESGVDFLGVSYGYGKKEDMIAAGCRKMADYPLEILDYILGE